jgi:hypothetical protein
MREGGVPNGYVACAVAIRTELRDAVVKLLPRDPGSGKPQKASSRNTTDGGLAAFLKSFFALDVAAGMLSVDSTDRANVETLQEAVDLANANNRARNRFKPMTTAYSLLAPKAVLQAWMAVCLRQRYRLERFSLVFDEANLPKELQERLTAAICESFQEQNVRVDDVRWASEDDETLLHVPDYIAGVSLRKFTRDDCPFSFVELQRAKDREQLRVQDPIEIYTLSPKPPPT